MSRLIRWSFLNFLMLPFSMALLNKTQIQWELTNFAAVSQFDDLETYYRSLRWQRIGAPPQESEKAKKRAMIRKAICKSAFSSFYFEMRREEYLNVDLKEVQEKLQTYYVDIFNSIYEKSKKLGVFWVNEYENAYKLRSVRVNGANEDEYMITCLTRDLQSGAIKQYFLTQQYNVNLVRDALPIMGRFIFVRGVDDSLIIHAMAEEAALRSEFLRKSKFTELLYVLATDNGLPTTTWEEDPMCKLSNVNKLRLCTTLMAAPVFKKNNIKFASTPDNVDVDCVLRQVSFISLESRRHRHRFAGFMTRNLMDPFRTYKEWTITCKAFTREENETMVYYVSRARGKNGICVFRPTEDNADQHVYLYNLFGNVSVVDRLRKRQPESVLQNDVED